MEPRRGSDDGRISRHVGEFSWRFGDEGEVFEHPPCTEATCLAPAANTWVHRYPNVLYGIDQCHAATLRGIAISAAADQGRHNFPDLIGTTGLCLPNVPNHLRHCVRSVAQQIGHEEALQD